MSTSSIRMMCPNLRCRSLLAVPPSARGKTVRCRQCGTRINVPAQAKGKDSPAAASTPTDPPQG